MHKRYLLDDRLHITDGAYKKISYIRLMNLAATFVINPIIDTFKTIQCKKGVVVFSSPHKINKSKNIYCCSLLFDIREVRIPNKISRIFEFCSFEKILEVKSNVQIKGLCFLYLL